jgi:hypothetical protein
MAPSLKPLACRNSRKESRSCCATIFTQATAPLALDHLPQVPRRLVPEGLDGPPLLVWCEVEGQAFRVALRVGRRHPLAADVDQSPRIAHHERSQLQAEQFAIRECQVMARGMRMPPASAWSPGAKGGGACRPDRPTRCCAFQDQWLVALAAQLEGGEPGPTDRPDHDHPLGRLRPRLEAPRPPRPEFRREPAPPPRAGLPVGGQWRRSPPRRMSRGRLRGAVGRVPRRGRSLAVPAVRARRVHGPSVGDGAGDGSRTACPKRRSMSPVTECRPPPTPGPTRTHVSHRCCR